MSQADHQRAYLAAGEKAQEQLLELFEAWEQLQSRREKLQKAAKALEILIQSEEQSTAGDQKVKGAAFDSESEAPKPTSRGAEWVVGSSPIPRKVMPGPWMDPIQSRINDVLGTAAVA